ncbi:MAG TPA: outer membrane beta-barrel protein [Saprospiraceae bacterium]
MPSFIRFAFFTFLLSISLSFSLSAQTTKTTFKGVIEDEAGTTIPGATLMILNASDSTLVQFGSSDNEGAFTIKNVPKGDYLLNVTFLGMAPLFQPITSGVDAEQDLGRIKLAQANTILSEVEVKADHVPIEITKDTISYNADAFQTQPNAVVEDLLKKLPGIEVAADGSIKAQGEDVQKILVDGKEFFGDDPKMATKNLPAKALKKVKVYDKQSDMAEFTGVDDGEREKTIDLQLKDEFKKGLFGTAEAGYGTDERYNAKASINRFSKTSQLSFLGQLNNINQQGFSFNDRMNFSGGMRGMSGGGGGGVRTMEMTLTQDAPFGDGSSNGLINTGAAGLNFNWQPSKKFNVRSSYFFNGVEKNLLQNSFRQNLSDDPFDTYEDSESITENQSHSIALNSDIKMDSTQQVKVNARIGIGNGISLDTSFLQNIIPDNLLQNQSLTRTDNGSDNFSLNANANYIKRLGNRGRNISIGGTIATGDQDTDSKLKALTEYLTTGETNAIDQLQYTLSNDVRLDGQVSFTEPLRKRRFLEFSYNFNTQNADYDHDVYDLENTNPVPNDTLSNAYSSIFQYHRPGITFRYSGEVNTVNAGIQYQVSELTGNLSRSETDIKQNYNHLLPRFIWRSNLGNGKNLRFNYTTRVNQPTIVQLSPVLDNSDPLRLYVGNPNLDAEYSHNLNFNFHSFSQFSSTSFFASVGGSITNNKIINSRFINEDFREISTPINIANEDGMNMYVSYGRPLKPIHSRVTLNGNFNFTNTQNVISDELLDLNRWSRTAGITISNMNSNVLEYNLGGTWTFSDNYYTSNEGLNQNTLLHTYFIDVTVTVWKKWKLQAGYDYNLYTSDQFAENQSLPLMEASISRFVLPGDKGQIKFSVFDVLDENRGISLTANPNYLEEIRSNSIGRYAMLSFIYSLRSGGAPPAGGEFRIIEQRR